jgi:hypothetical protein
MTATQVRNLMTKHNVAGEVTGAGRKWSVELANDAALRKFRKHVTKEVGGYKCGYGAWVMSPQHESQGDWNDRAARFHY